MCPFVSLSYILITCRNCSFISLARIVIESGLAYVFTDLEESLYLEKLAVVLALCCLKTVIIEPNYLEEKNWRYLWVNKDKTLQLDILRYGVKCYNTVESKENKVNKLIKAEEGIKQPYINMDRYVFVSFKTP